MLTLHSYRAGGYDDPEKDLCAVRRINDRWIVHGRLRENTALYLLHLEETDPVRLARACQVALTLIKDHREKTEDPKALFYSGIFSGATSDEIARFLPEHFLTGAVASLLRGDYDKLKALPAAARPLAETLARRIRESISRI